MALLSEASLTDPKQVIDALNNVVAPYGVSYPKDDLDVCLTFARKVQPVHDSVVDKLRAYDTLSKPVAYQHWHIFEKVANFLLDGIGTVEYVTPPTEQELAFTCWIIQRDFPDMLKHLNEEVQTYVTTVWGKYYGYAVPHPVMLNFWRDDRTLIGPVFEMLEYLERAEHVDITRFPMDIVEGQAIRLYTISQFLKDYGYSVEWHKAIVRRRTVWAQ
ncbi:MAG: hypothetical protein P3W91_006495 [Fervidobacterium sp.]|nr:hypothetical protein [Fervidobacterium sp.]